jgi:hypothetical protein
MVRAVASCFAHLVMLPDGFHYLETAGKHRVQRSHRLLEDHGHLVAADGLQFFNRHLQHVNGFIINSQQYRPNRTLQEVPVIIVRWIKK